MKTDLHLHFEGTCAEAFAFYEKTFHSKIMMSMKYGDAPPGTPGDPAYKDLIMHTSLPVGSMLLMGCDACGRGKPIGGFQISLSTPDEAEAKRLFAELSEGGNVGMPLGPTFWSPLFGMLTDKFGVGWMVSLPGPELPQS
jgi:PhnB protein